MNRRELLKRGLIVMGGVALPLGKIMGSEFNARPWLSDLRSDTVTDGLVLVTGKVYEAITDADLLKIKVLDLPHVHIDTFFENDFDGLTNLKELAFRSVFHSKPGFPEKVFSELDGLERISLEFNQFLDLPDDVFSPLENLRVLDLRYASFARLPKSILEFKTLEMVIATGVKAEHKQQLKNKYGSLVQG